MILINDKIIFSLFEVFLVLIFIFSIYRVNMAGKRGITITVKRGQESWQLLYLFYGITSIIMIQIITVARAFENYKVGISLLNLGILLYLTFYNSWFRNKILGYITKSKEQEERHG